MSRTLQTVVCCLGFALMSASVLPAVAEPRCSERQISAAGTPGRIHFTGRRNARLAWAAKVRAEFGQAYASWDRASSRRFECSFSERRFRCTAAARPCRSIVSAE
jgi:hypothetical protein